MPPVLRLRDAALARTTLAGSALAALRRGDAVTPAGETLPAARAVRRNLLMGLRPAALDWVQGVHDPSSASGPLLDDASAVVVPDAGDPAKQWSLPSFEVDPPAADVTASTFGFLLRRLPGLTAEGEVALEATISLRLREAAPPTAEEGKTLERVALEGLRAELVLPFRQAGGEGALPVPSAVAEDGGGLVVTVVLSDDAVRLAYAALAGPQGDEPPARLRLSWTCRGVRHEELATFPLIPQRELFVEPILTLRQPEVPPVERSVAEPAADVSRLAMLRAARVVPLRAMTSRAPVDLSEVVRLTRSAEGDAATEPTSVLVAATREVEQELQLRFACKDVPELYREEHEGGAVRLGCTDALRLGETPLRLFDELTDLAVPGRLRVFKSREQPDRYLVLPATYRVARVEPGGPEAYAPAARWFSALNTGQAEGCEVQLRATLVPDLTPYERDGLVEALRGRSAGEPVLLLPTQTAATVECGEWTTGAGPTVAVVHDGLALQVVVSATLLQALALRDILAHTSVGAEVRFGFADGTTLQSAASIDLAMPTGPWLAGPVEAVVGAGTVTLTNRVGQPIAVDALTVVDDAAGRLSVAVGQTLAPGASTQVQVAGNPVEAIVGLRQLEGDRAQLAESRTFLDDVHLGITVVCQLAPATHGWTSIDVELALAGVEGTYSMAFADSGALDTVDVLEPLAHQAAGSPRVLTCVARCRAGEQVAHEAQFTWDVDTQGAVVGLTAALLGLASTTSTNETQGAVQP